ncbi:MAG: hypothetical protein GF320_22930, partial [Armatimonadia bacterium]|nr:hypothetical protein [Armatimonadia bacterium]
MGGLLASLLVIAAQAGGGDRAVILDVPYMGPRWQEFLDGPQDFSFPSSMAAAMAYVDEDHPYGYRAYMAICGISFRQCWNPDQAEVTFDNIWIQDDDPSEPLRRCFDAAGFGYQLLINDDVEPDQSLPAATPGERVSASGLKDAVIASIGAGQPVIGISAFGPHVIAGYDHGGDVALGWGQCEGMDDKPAEDPSGYLVFPDWLARTAGVVLIGDRIDRPDVDDVYREWLRWAVEGMRQPAVAGRATGLASFDAWTAALAPGEPLPDDLQGDQLQQRVGVHDLHALGIAEGRAFGGELLERAADRFADAQEPLSDAAECCWEMHDLIWCLWGVLGGHGPPTEEQRDRFSEPEVRAELARTVGMLAELDAQVVRSMEVALHRIGEPLADVPNALSVDDADPDTALGWRPDHGHENMDIWIRGAPAMGWGQGTDHQDVAVLAAALAPTERPVAYNDLMGYSGAAFGTDWAGDRE